MSDTYKPDIKNIYETGGIFFEFFKTIPSWTSGIPGVGWVLDWVLYILIKVFSILAIPIRLIFFIFSDPKKFLDILGDLFSNIMDNLTVFTSWNVLKFIFWSLSIFLIICFIPFRKMFEKFSKSTVIKLGYFISIITIFIVIPFSLFFISDNNKDWEKFINVIKNFPSGTYFTPGYFWPNLLFYSILFLSPLLFWLLGAEVNNGLFGGPIAPNTSRFEQILTGLLNIPGVLFTIPLFGLSLFTLIALYYSYKNISSFRTLTSPNDIINVILTSLLFLGLMYCVYKIYQNQIPTGNNLNIALIVSFLVSILLFLINILKPFVPNLPNIPGLNQLLLFFYGFCALFLSFVVVFGIQKVTEKFGGGTFFEYIINHKYKFWGLYSSILFIINYLLNHVRSHKWSEFFGKKQDECKKDHNYSDNETESRGYKECMREANETEKINMNVSQIVWVLSFIIMLFGTILIDVNNFIKVCNTDNFVVYLLSLLIILIFCFIVFQSYSEKYNPKSNENGEKINQRYNNDDIISSGAYVPGNFIFTAAAALIIISLISSIGGVTMEKSPYDKNYSWNEKLSWLAKMRNRMLVLGLYGFSFYIFFWFIGKTFNETMDNNTFNNLFILLGGGILLSFFYFYGDKLFPEQGFSRIIFNMILIIPCLCQLLLVSIWKDLKNTPSIVYLILLVEVVLISIYVLTSSLARFYVEDYFIIKNSKIKVEEGGTITKQYGDETCNRKYKNKGIIGKIITKKEGSIEKSKKILDNPQYLDRETIPGFIVRNKETKNEKDDLCMSQKYRHKSGVESQIIKPESVNKERNARCEKLTLDNLFLNKINVRQNYNYALSFWVFLHTQGSNYRESYNKYTNILDFGSYPIIDYNISTDTLRVRIGVRLPEKCRTKNRDTCCNGKKAKKTVGGKKLKDGELNMIELWCRENMTIGNPMPDEHYLTVFEKEGLLKRQKWNNIVINYDLGVLDIFINSELVGTWKNVVSYQTSKKIKIGQYDGIAGGICNVIYYPTAIKLFQIHKHYNLLKSTSPPLI
tara:strand:+ start:2194 stop:5280 length:3087 start_codon:yes stop_codon:yes gene_type:complete